ncbi:MAG: peptidoglycan D,D-transpeptidase FtsI family protein [Cyanophyceae cyanobacterium]
MDRPESQSNPFESTPDFDLSDLGTSDPDGNMSAPDNGSRRSRQTLEKLEALGNALPEDGSTVTRLPLQPFDTNPYRDHPPRNTRPSNVTPFPRRDRPKPPERTTTSPSNPVERLKNLSTEALRALRWQWPDPRSISPSRMRVLMVGMILFGGTGLLSWRLFTLQVLQAAELQAKAKGYQELTITPFVPRRSIVDHRGTVLALDRRAYTLYAHPSLFKERPGDIAEKLAPVVDMSTDELMRIFAKGKTGLRLRNRLSEDTASRVRSLNTDGLELVQQASRVYPQQELMADVLGYTDLDSKGQAGLELRWQKLLQRKADPLKFERSSSGVILASPGQGDDDQPQQLTYLDDLKLKLTLDSRLQRAARLALDQTMDQYKAKKATAIVMDARTGALRVLANAPTYDPNRYFDADVANFRNWAVADLYEPGSTFKPLVVAAALESKKIEPTETFNDPGAIQIFDRLIKNYGYPRIPGRGTVSVEDIIQYSSNVGMVRISQRFKPAEFYDWLQRMGLGDKSGVDLPFETASQVRSRAKFLRSPVDRATNAFGQGFSVTPLQLVQMMGTLANGGELVTPHVVEGLMTDDNQPYWQPYRSQPTRLFSKITTTQVVEMMESVVQSGTAKAAQIPGYRIAGKTGTSQKIGSGGVYRKGAIIASFVGILPASNPRYVVAVIVDEPQGGSGGKVAAPPAKMIMETLIALERIPPDAKK